MRLILFSFLFLLSVSCYSQENNIIKYFDSLWRPVSKDTAYFYTEFIKQDSFYNCSSYWVQSGNLFCKSTYRDTLFEKPLGKLVRYYENRLTQDSIYYNNDGSTKELFHFYNSGKLWAHCNYKQPDKTEICEAFDEYGKSIKDFIYLKEAEFPGGNIGWSVYLERAMRKFDPSKKGAPVGMYEVIIRFIVDKNGIVSDAEAETNLGYGMEDKAIEIIKKSPRWAPLIFLGKPGNAYRRQPVTFLVTNE